MENRSRQRVIFLGCVFLLCGWLLAYRLYKLQVVENISWATQAVNQRSDSLALYRQRGAIFDYRGNHLTGRGHRTYLAVFPLLLTAAEWEELAPLIANEHGWLGGTLPVIIANPSAELLRFATERKITGVTFCSIPLRYGTVPLAQHLLGYVHPTTGTGLAGLEAVYDEVLTSEGMINLTIMKDALERPIPGLGWRYQEEVGAQAGKNLVLTLDLALQSKVEKILNAAQVTKGAVVLMEVGTGKIRALASRPVFDPYVPQQSLNDPAGPLVNRALQAYPPASLWKIILAAAALESGSFHPEQIFYDAETGHGLVTLTQAFAYGCPSIFQEIMAKLGNEPVLSLAKQCGLGATRALGFPEEATGSLPTKVSSRDGTRSATEGQGVSVTPLQIAGLLQIIAGNGVYNPPAVVEGILDPEEELSQLATGPLPSSRQVLSRPTVTALRKMLEAVVLYGTGQMAQTQQGAAGIGGSMVTGEVTGRPLFNSWFAGYAPAHGPKLVGVVFLENDPGGEEKAAAIFASLLSNCLEKYHP